MDEFGRVWMSLVEFGRVWMSLDGFGRVWKSLDEFGRVWMSLDGQTGLSAGATDIPTCFTVRHVAVVP